MEGGVNALCQSALIGQARGLIGHAYLPTSSRVRRRLT